MNEYKKLLNQPLKFVLAEFRFSPVMQIAEYIPKIQEALRKQYPTPTKKSERIVTVQPDGIGVSAIDQWAFISASKNSAIDINQERLIYMTTEYSRFAGFSDACKQAVDTLMSIVEPSLVLRIGLRYGDLIEIDEGDNISALVKDHFGLPQCIDDSIGAAEQQRTETFVRTTVGGLLIRSLYGKHNLTCLSDLQGMAVPVKADAAPSKRIILDFDHFWEAKEEAVDFETNDILQKLNDLHVTSRAAFWKVTTDYARNTKWA